MLYGLVLFQLVRMAFNALDGMLAVHTNQQSARGAFLNEMCDVISDLGLYFPFIAHPAVNTYLIVFLLFLSMLTEFTGIAAHLATGERAFQGPFGKSDRAVFFTAFAITLNFISPTSTAPHVFLSIGIFLSLLTIANRSQVVWNEVNE
jgi:CDP-diacylglycerol--glycerol-3-phosphate 3-phosphatidyltransferase